MRDFSKCQINGPAKVLLDELGELYQALRAEMKSSWNRDLPLDELLFDRWERAKMLGFGENSSIYHNSYIFGDVRVGKNTWIGPSTLLDGSAGLEIGDNCSISAGVQIYTHSSVKWAVSNGRELYEKQPVKIGSCCFVGPNTIINHGVSIGEHSIVGAASFINQEIEPYSIVVGSPGRRVGKVIIENTKVEFEYFNNK